MKILYIASSSSNDTSGVKKKLLKKIEIFNSCGVTTHALFLSNNPADAEVKEAEHITYLPTNYEKVPKIYNAPFLWRFHIFYENKIFYKKLTAHLSKIIDQYDKILFRYPIFTTDLNFIWFMRKFKNKIVIKWC